MLLAPTQNKIILAFGGAGGIGAEVSARLASEGARVVVADLNAAETKLAGIQFILGDLAADTTPSAKLAPGKQK